MEISNSFEHISFDQDKVEAKLKTDQAYLVVYPDNSAEVMVYPMYRETKKEYGINPTDGKAFAYSINELDTHHIKEVLDDRVLNSSWPKVKDLGPGCEIVIRNWGKIEVWELSHTPVQRFDNSWLIRTQDKTMSLFGVRVERYPNNQSFKEQLYKDKYETAQVPTDKVFTDMLYDKVVSEEDKKTSPSNEQGNNFFNFTSAERKGKLDLDKVADKIHPKTFKAKKIESIYEDSVSLHRVDAWQLYIPQLEIILKSRRNKYKEMKKTAKCHAIIDGEISLAEKYLDDLQKNNFSDDHIMFMRDAMSDMDMVISTYLEWKENKKCKEILKQIKSGTPTPPIYRASSSPYAAFFNTYTKYFLELFNLFDIQLTEAEEKTLKSKLSVQKYAKIISKHIGSLEAKIDLFL